MTDDDLSQLPATEPVAWMYGNVTGFRTVHWADRLDAARLENDKKAARDYPGAHWVVPLYRHAKEGC